jgi:hypothetical protein
MTMSFDNQRHNSSFDPHGYECVFVDENCLTDGDARAAIVDAVAHPDDWMSFLTHQERKALAMALDEIEKNISPFFYCPGEMPAMTEKQAEFARRGMFRAYARQAYAGGHGIWYGDNVPWEQPAG